MAPAMWLALLLAQDVDEQVDALLNAFELQRQFEQRALLELATRLSALGATAADPIARRLEEDLSDGRPSPEAPALLRALDGRDEEAMVIESLRLRVMAADEAERGRLMKLLGEAGTPGALMLLDDLARALPPPPSAPGFGDEPRVTVVEDPSADRPGSSDGDPAENPETPSPGRGTAYTIALGTLGAGIVLLLLSFLRKGSGR